MLKRSQISLFHVSRKARNLDVSSNQSIIDAKPFLEARVNYNLPVPQKYFRVYCPYLQRAPNPLPFGSELGRFRGVPAYSCHYESADPDKFRCDWDYMSYYCFDKGTITSTGGKELMNLRCDEAVVSCALGCDKSSSCILSGNSLQSVTLEEVSAKKTSATPSTPTTSSTTAKAPSRKQIGIYLGHMFQCVMASRFWLVKTYGLTFQDVSMAYDIFELEHFYRILHVGETSKQHKMEKVKVLKVRNDGKTPKADTENGVDVLETGLYKKPLPGNILIWEEGGFFKHTGHVAVITDVVEKSESVTVNQFIAAGVEVKRTCNFGVRVWEQNFNDEYWQGRSYSRELPAYVDETTGAFVIVEPIWKSRVKGWMATRCMIERERKLAEEIASGNNSK